MVAGKTGIDRMAARGRERRVVSGHYRRLPSLICTKLRHYGVDAKTVRSGALVRCDKIRTTRHYRHQNSGQNRGWTTTEIDGGIRIIYRWLRSISHSSRYSDRSAQCQPQICGLGCLCCCRFPSYTSRSLGALQSSCTLFSSPMFL